jgi:putative transposase
MAKRRWLSGQGAFWGDKVGPNPTDRGKNGTKKSLLVEQQGGPLAAVVEAANVHDTKLLKATLEAVVIERPKATSKSPQNLCLDAGYDNPTGRAAATSQGHTPHLRPIREEKPVRRGPKKHKPRRWVVERTLGWLSKCRAILVRFDKNSFNYLGLIQLACALLWYRRLHRLSTA